MELPNYIYTNRAVAFLDVLGFQNKLKEFEDEAIQFYSDFVADNIEDDTDEDEVGGRVYYSQKATDFIETFNKWIGRAK